MADPQAAREYQRRRRASMTAAEKEAERAKQRERMRLARSTRPRSRVIKAESRKAAERRVSYQIGPVRFWT